MTATPPTEYDSDSVSSLIEDFFSGWGPDGDPIPDREPLNVEDCLIEMIHYVEIHNLEYMFGSTYEEQRRVLLPQAEIASQLPLKLKYIKTDLAISLVVMSLYDLAILIGRCISRGHFRISTLKNNS